VSQGELVNLVVSDPGTNTAYDGLHLKLLPVITTNTTPLTTTFMYLFIYYHKYCTPSTHKNKTMQCTKKQI